MLTFRKRRKSSRNKKVRDLREFLRGVLLYKAKEPEKLIKKTKEKKGK
jgi:hypothetical protein